MNKVKAEFQCGAPEVGLTHTLLGGGRISPVLQTIMGLGPALRRSTKKHDNSNAETCDMV